ncbi:hypothetical protein Tco_0845448 [Tanacetum coccineum]
MLSLRESMELDLEARLIGENSILNRSLDPLYGDYIELNNLNEPLELRRNQVDDLEPTIEEGEVVNEPKMDLVKTRCDFIDGLDDYPSHYDYDRKIHVNCAYNLIFSCMIGFEHVSANFLLNLSINIVSRMFYNSIMKDKSRRTWIFIRIRIWETLLLENHFARFHVLKQEVIMEYLVKISKKARILELKRRHLKKLTLTSYMPYPSKEIYDVSVPALHKKSRRYKVQYAISRRTPYTVIKEEFEKLESLKISDDSFTCNTSLEIFHKEFNRMSRMDDDLFTYEVEIPGLASVPCDLNDEDDSEQHMTHGSDVDMEYDPSNTGGDDEVELTDEESSDSNDGEVANP